MEFPKEPRISHDAIDFIRELLTRDINKRIGVGEQGFKRLKKHPWLKNMCWDILSSKATGAPFIPDVSCVCNKQSCNILIFFFIGKKIKFRSNARVGRSFIGRESP